MKHFSTILLVLLISLSLAQAQYKPESGLLIFNVGFTKASPEDSDKNLNGNTFSLSYEKSNYQGNLAGGVSIAYSTTSADSINEAGQQVQRLNSVSNEVLPILLFGKVLFGSPKVRGFIGGGFGIQFSKIRTSSERGQVQGVDSGILVGGTAGINFFLNDKILLNANYSLSYLGNSYYKDGLAQNFNIGLGFQFY